MPKLQSDAVQAFLVEKGISCEIFSSELQGEARDYGKRLVDLIPKFHIETYPMVFVGTDGIYGNDSRKWNWGWKPRNVVKFS